MGMLRCGLAQRWWSVVGAASFVVASVFWGVSAPRAVDALERRAIPTSATIRSLFFVDDAGNTGIAVGDDGNVFVTSDRAASWRRVSPGTGADLHAVTAGGCAGCVLAVGDAGTILLSTDAGNTWCRQESSTTRDLRGVATLGPTAVAVGAAGTVVRTPDATRCGASYTPLLSTGRLTTFSDVVAADGEFFVVGSGGTAFAVGSDGSTRPIDSGTLSDLEAVDAAGTSPGTAEARACDCTQRTSVVAVAGDGTVVRGGTATRLSTGERPKITSFGPSARISSDEAVRDIVLWREPASTSFNLVAVGDQGTAFVADYRGWKRVGSGTCADLHAVLDRHTEDLSIAAGEAGTVVLGVRTSTESPHACPEVGDRTGYRFVASDGGVFAFGDRRFHGSAGDLRLSQPVVAGTTRPTDMDGYWLVARDGGVFAFGADFHGSLGGESLSAPAVDIEATPTGGGYWIVLSDGTVRPFGDARTHGDLAGMRLNRPIVAMESTPTGGGYWLLGADGGVFTFGDAVFHGSTGDSRLNAPVIDLAAASTGGYYLLARDGGVFTFGDAAFHGSTGDLRLNAPVVSMRAVAGGPGYWLAAADGGVFTFGSLPFHGSTGGMRLNSPILDLVG